MFDKLLHPIHAARNGMVDQLVGGEPEKEEMPVHTVFSMSGLQLHSFIYTNPLVPPVCKISDSDPGDRETTWSCNLNC